jgi:hypothetical protein
MTYPCSRCNMDEGSPVCLQDERCPKRSPKPDCRTCAHYRYADRVDCCCADICTNADRYDPLPVVQLWRKT